MQIILNGKKEEISENATLTDVLKGMELPKFFVVEHNKEIVYKEKYDTITLKDGDELEVASFCGGG